VNIHKTKKNCKLRLVARLLLLKSLAEQGKESLLNDYTKNAVNKPVIPNWNDFSISHSGDLVVFCESSTDVGIDLELIAPLDFEDLASFFHTDEKEYIKSGDIRNRFYEIWVKKEAVLKAIGTGIISGLDAFSCLGNPIVVNDKKWYFYPLVMDERYMACVCSNQLFEEIILEEVSPEQLIGSLLNKRD
jgi:4'-phosphopantetheinyl transferase